MRGFDFDCAGRRIDSWYQNEDGDEQRKQHRHQSKSAALLHHPGRVTRDEAERPYLRSPQRRRSRTRAAICRHGWGSKTAASCPSPPSMNRTRWSAGRKVGSTASIVHVAQYRFGDRGRIRTKFVEPETFPARTGLFRETWVHQLPLTPARAADHVRVCGTPITVNQAPVAPEQLFSPCRLHRTALR